jgi:hypothetical protein
LIETHCPRAIVVSVMHETAPPVDDSGRPFYTSVLQVSDGRARLVRLTRPAADVEPDDRIAAKATAAE